MFLRSLTLKGFKSFAEATTLELEPGLTVVVGPNGSGKSNIVDAVAWVLGAQGPRTVRSQRMEDVIFAGSGKRSALGRAEVALTIDNSAGLLPIGFTEVTLTRTLFRASGESEYAINGVPCRLLDLQELLSDTGVGRQQHVIVSQGNLDQVLDVRPEDRRLIVEEAAGILKFRRRKEKAERRLEATESHLVRLSDLLKELRRGMRPLERQADAALRHDGLAAELRALSVYLSGRTLAGLTARAEAGARELARFGRDETAALAELRRLDGDISTLEGRLAPMGGGALDGAAARLEALRERARGVGAVLAERARSLAAEVAAAEGGDLGLDPLARLEADAVTLAGELSAAEEESARLEDAASSLAEAEAELAARRARLAARQAAEATRRRAAEARGELAALAASAERARVELAAVEARLADLDKVVAEAEDKVTAAREVRGAAAARRADVTAALAHARAGATEAAARRAAALAARQRAERAADAATARVEALSLSVTAADPPHAGPAGGPVGLGTLLALVRIEAGWEAAVEAALGDALTAVVMSGPADVRAALAAFESAGRPGPPTAYLPAALGPGVGAATAPEAVPGAVPLVGKVASVDRAVGALLERLLAGAVAVDGGWEAALAVAEARPDLCAVTRAGDRFGPGGWKLAGEAPSLAAALAAARQRADDAVAAAIEARAAEEQAAAEAD
ncbi:MAG: AAA family ATPase, partial [Actinomycetota bacterium]